MARESKYFKHDINARNDPKMLQMRSVYGAAGYGMYFMLIEILREQDNYKYPVSKYMCNALAMQMQCKVEDVQKFIDDCCHEFGDKDGFLLETDSEYLYSNSLLRRMEEMNTTSQARKAAANSRWKEQQKKEETEQESAKTGENNANEMQAQCKSNANAIQMNNACNANQCTPPQLELELELELNNKKKSIEKKGSADALMHTRFTKPTVQEIEAYCKERNNNIDAQRFFDYNESRGWVVGKTKMKDWRAAVRTWERNQTGGQASGRAEKTCENEYAELNLGTRL